MRNLLKKTYFHSSDIEKLISDDADEWIEEIRRLARNIRLRNFGRTVRLYRPIYVSNYCVNDCSYCGCGVSIKRRRKILSPDEITAECEAVRKDGIDSVLLVAGEDKSTCNVEYLVSAIATMKKFFSFVAIEAGVFSENECEAILKAGADSFVLYQETYDAERYRILHKGPKKDFEKRLFSLQVAADAGFQSVGMGILLGIADWRNDALALAKHAEQFRRKNWDCAVSFSFPRLRPPADDKFPEFKVNEAQLEKIMLAFRIVFPDAEINISTRESAAFRERIVQTSATTMSAASATFPGAYSSAENNEELEQFEIEDKRTVREICNSLEKSNLQPVFKYWDRALTPN